MMIICRGEQNLIRLEKIEKNLN
ncbi:hypothetical protein Godav_013885, partial [Gossypium davidsonii]|nr:hypothetical protein [Gossypium davidsonii]